MARRAPPPARPAPDHRHLPGPPRRGRPAAQPAPPADRTSWGGSARRRTCSACSPRVPWSPSPARAARQDAPRPARRGRRPGGAAGQRPAGTLGPSRTGATASGSSIWRPWRTGRWCPRRWRRPWASREVPGQPLAGVLAGALRERALLLVLDNCEHLLDACARLVETLLRAAPGCGCWPPAASPCGPPARPSTASPRWPPRGAPGHRPGRGARRAPELVASYPAVRLFVERARAVPPGLRRHRRRTPRPSREVCRRLDGLPLAIELAAARVRVLSAAADRRPPGRPPRACSPAAPAPPAGASRRCGPPWTGATTCSPPPEQALLRRLSVFAGGWTLEAAEAVAARAAGAGAADALPADVPADVLDLLTSLVDKSLVGAPAGADGATPGAAAPLPAAGDGAPVRRRSAWQPSGEAGRARDAHARYYLDLAERASPQLLGPEQARWHARLEAEHDNLRAALAWCVQQRRRRRGPCASPPPCAGSGTAGATGTRATTWPARVLALPGAQGPTPVRAERAGGGRALRHVARPPGRAGDVGGEHRHQPAPRRARPAPPRRTPSWPGC